MVVHFGGKQIHYREFSDGLAISLMKIISKGLILAQNERWRRGLGMQVVRTAM